MINKMTFGSETTKNIAYGSAATMGPVAAALFLASTLVPGAKDFLTPEVQSAILVLAASGIPYVSRAIAFWRDPSKSTRKLELSTLDPPAELLNAAVFAVRRSGEPHWRKYAGASEDAWFDGYDYIALTEERIWSRATGNFLKGYRLSLSKVMLDTSPGLRPPPSKGDLGQDTSPGLRPPPSKGDLGQDTSPGLQSPASNDDLEQDKSEKGSV